METEDRPSPGRRALVGLALLAVFGAIAGWGVAQRGAPTPVALPDDPSVPGGTPGGVYVHVAGAVPNPGLYRLEADARVDDAVRAAGGAREDADLDSLNLAARVADGDKIVVPVKGAAQAASASGPGPPGTVGGKINLNTASQAELETLPGVGPSTAQKIIEFRTSNGGFRSVKDLLKVSGIGPKRFEDLQDKVTV